MTNQAVAARTHAGTMYDNIARVPDSIIGGPGTTLTFTYETADNDRAVIALAGFAPA
jgi:hypothetical protein